jgi:hypothetical protein
MLEVIPERAEAVRLIFRLAAEGLGRVRIIKELVKRNVPPFGAKVVNGGRTRSQFLGQWSNGFVGALLADRRVIGEFQPRKGKKPDGAPVIGYYPEVVSSEEFALARAAQEKHFGLDTLQRRKSTRQRQYVNIFGGMLVHARDGEGFVIQNRGTTAKPELLLLNSTGRCGRSRNYTFSFATFEEGILSQLRELDPASILPRESAEASKADALRAKLAGIREDIAGIQVSLQKKFSPALIEVLHRIEADEERVANELQDELVRTAKPLKRAWKDVPSLIDVIRDADDPDAARLRLRTALRPLVAEIRVLIVPRYPWQLAPVQVYFTGGATRHYLFARKSAGNRRPGGWEVKSFADTGLPDLDLRKPGDVQKLERLLTRLDLQ